MKKMIKRAAAAALALTIAGGALPAVSGDADLFAASIVADAADEVGVGTRWYIGDTIDTDAYFDVMLPTYDSVSFEQEFVNKTLQLKNTTLPECWPLYLPSREFNGVIYEDGSKGVQFTGVIDCVTLSCDYYRMAWDNETEEFWGRDSDFWEIAFYYGGELSDVKGIEITGGSGTYEDPFILALIIDESITPNVPIAGDADCNGEVGMNDVVLIMQALSNNDKYGPEGTDSSHITDDGMKNSDVEGNGNGVTSMDALQVQKYLLSLVDELVIGG